MKLPRSMFVVLGMALVAAHGVTVAAGEPRLFPSGLLGNNEASDREIVAGFTKMLTASEEQSLFAIKPDPDRVSCRLLWRRSFHAPVVIRAEVQAKKTKIHVKVLKYDPASREYHLIRTEVRRPDDSGYALLLGTIKRNKIALWNMSPPDSREPGVDGSSWTLELLVDGKYKVISRWSPSDGPLYELGRIMIEQAIGGDLIPIY